MSTYYLSNHYYPAPLSNAWQLAKLGAVVGMSGAGAVQLRRYRDRQVSREEALAATFKAGLQSGIATGVAGVVAAQFRAPTLSLLATLVSGTAVMYALNQASEEKAP